MRERSLTLISGLVITYTLFMITLFFVTSYEVFETLVFLICPISFYLAYLMCTFQDGLKNVTGEGKSAWGHFWASTLTIGIYLLYWYYAVGKRLNLLGAKDRSKIYFSINLVSYVISIMLSVIVFYSFMNLQVISILYIITVINSALPVILYGHMQYVANKLIAGNLNKQV